MRENIERKTDFPAAPDQPTDPPTHSSDTLCPKVQESDFSKQQTKCRKKKKLKTEKKSPIKDVEPFFAAYPC